MLRARLYNRMCFEGQIVLMFSTTRLFPWLFSQVSVGCILAEHGLKEVWKGRSVHY